MDFRILGPLEVVGEGGAVALGGIKPRAVLAVLLLHPNEPVSADRLALALWGADAPAGAAKTVQVHVSRLRKALGDAEILTTTPGGYRLRVRAGELDAERFELLAEDGRRALAAGQVEHAAAVLRDALSMWRGPPLEDLAFEPFAPTEIARLEEQRLAVLEARVEADLAVGRHGELLGELQRLRTGHPSRERFVGQLMLALYRCGRQAEALEAYRQARRVFVDELGVEPGPEVRRLHEAILRQDASLELTTALAELPSELDVSTAVPFAGRAGELAWLWERWEHAATGAGAIVTVAGERAIGKSRVMAELAVKVHRHGAPALYVAGDGPAERALTAFGHAREATRPTLLVVDDADHAGADVLAALADLTAALATVPVLVLASAEDADVIAGAGARLDLTPLGAQEVRAIALGYVPGRMDEDVPVDWLLDASGGVPGRIHEIARRWARREAARRVGAVAGRTATGRAELRSMEAELTGDVVELQAARERGAPDGGGAAPVVCPFKGLASFDVDDAPYFFGRERLVAELVARLVGAPLLGVVGPSGSGKSSVLRAGLLPALASGVLPGSADWTQIVMRPGEHPLGELGRATADLGGDRWVLAVDQFEETFTACADEQEREAFIAALARMAQEGQERCIVVLAIRADYYGRCAAYPQLSSLLAPNHVLVGPMRRDELRRAVQCPAQRAGLSVEPRLADSLVEDVESTPGGLPLLSAALLELWQRRDGRRLCHDAYVRTGGVRGAVARLAEAAFTQLDRTQQTAARSLLMRLVAEGADGAAERRRVPLAELEIGAGDEIALVLAVLTDRRLLTVGAGAVELAHEALLREWPRLRGWLDDDAQGRRVQRHLTSTAHEWDQRGRDHGDLYRGSRLASALEWAGEHEPELNRIEREFLAASDARRSEEQAARKRRLRLAFAGLTIALATITVVAIVALSEGREANRQRDIAVSQHLTDQSRDLLSADPGLSLGLALEAFKRQDIDEARSALRQATLATRATAVWRGHDGALRSVTPSRDGRYVATGGQNGRVRIWSLADGRVVSTIRGHHGDVYGTSFGPGGRRVATAGADGVVAIADADGRHRRVLRRFAKGTRVTGVEFSADGRRLVAALTDGTIHVLAVQGGGDIVLRGHDGPVDEARFNRDATRVVSAGADHTVRIWDVASRGFTLLSHPDEVASASFSPDDRWVVSASHDGNLRIWNADGSGRPRLIHADLQALYSVRYSADGRRLVTAGEDGVVRLWDVGGGPALGELRGHRGRALRASFVPGSDAVVSAGEDGTLRVWTPLRVVQTRALVTGASISSDNRRVVGGTEAGPVRLWDLKTRSVATLRGQTQLSFARFSPDGTRIVAASSDGSVRIWSADGRLSSVVRSGSAPKYAAAIDPAGGRVAIGGEDPTIVIRPLRGGADVRLSGHTEPVYDVAFSPDGRHLISGSEDGTARIWNTASGKQERVLRGHREAVNSAAYSADGKRVVTAGSDATVRVWDVADGRAVILRGHEGPLTTARFNHDGDRVVSAGQDGTVRVWSSAGGETLVLLYTHRGRASGADFSPDGKSVVSAGDDGIMRRTACETCGALPAVLDLARARADRELSPVERRRFLSQGG
jgi:WD40 repeat protein/DNA-binding SARP family transcriptional activator